MTNTNGNDIISIDKEEITIEKADDIRVQLRNEPEVQNIARQIDAKISLNCLNTENSRLSKSLSFLTVSSL